MMNSPSVLPRFIGLCGHPKSGKSLVQDILMANYNVKPVDDGRPLREIAKEYLGLSHDDVYTQLGKAGSTEILGRLWVNREILGELGNRLEAMFGEHILPFMSTMSLKGDGPFSFGSVRKTQGWFYKDNGGVIIGIDNPQASPSPYPFDVFDKRAVDYWINNDGLHRGLSHKAALADLEVKVDAAMIKIAGRKQAA